MHVKTSAPFAEMLNSPGQAGEVIEAFDRMIAESFAVDGARKARARGLTGTVQVQATMAEAKRRAKILMDWFKVMRGDMGWSMSRTLDELPRALRAQLDGDVYVPDKRNLWAPQPNQGDQA